MLIRYFKNPCLGREGIFMFTSDHQLRQLVFRTTSDFSYGVNSLAIGTLKFIITRIVWPTSGGCCSGLPRC